MTLLHPELLWAQRSSESDETMVLLPTFGLRRVSDQSFNKNNDHVLFRWSLINTAQQLRVSPLPPVARQLSTTTWRVDEKNGSGTHPLPFSISLIRRYEAAWAGKTGVIG
ncbi:hypothetical protein B0H14DRAFT_2564377 [Mycena olivaceomarginata]|nr:hypothetical protein B0H14DRAFT_2564377 [Mycena olivaceomarginata]